MIFEGREKMRCLAIIPARSGSKGLLHKNIKSLEGKPLIAYTIEAALESDIFDEVMVSTDSELYAAIAKTYGANVPFMRSALNSSDSASSWDTVKEILLNYEEQGQIFDAFCLLQPTSPLRTAQDIKNAYEILKAASVAVVSVCKVEHSPMWCNNLPEDNSLNNFIMRANNKQRQAIKEFYRINGSIYFVRIPAFLEDAHLYREGSYAYLMPQTRSIDIDTELDFQVAGIFLKNKELL